jgi:predicted metal-dependent hydrolase
MNVTIKRQNRKSLAMRVTPAGDVLVMIPTWLKPNHPDVKQFIQDGLEKLAPHIPEQTREPVHNAASVRRIVRKWAKIIGVSPSRVQFRAMTRKWGSCSTKGSITLNTALYYLPLHLVEYVVVHELIHMLVFDHSPKFWAKVGEFVPDYAERVQELNQHPC